MVDSERPAVEVKQRWAQLLNPSSGNQGGKLVKQNTLRSLAAMSMLAKQSIKRSRYDIQVLSPTSPFRVLWDVLACIIGGMDLVLIPAALSGLKLASGASDNFIQWMGRLFWTLDMCLGFFTGFERSDGSLERAFKHACVYYAKHEFILDFALVCINWAEIWSDSIVMQTFALLRLVRLSRLNHVLQMLMHSMYSESLVLFVRILQSMLLMCAFVHIMACGWLGLGRQSHGWLANRQMEESSDAEQYAVSFHWALSQFYGSTDQFASNLQERNAACMSLLFAFFAATAFVSDVTSSLTRLHMLTGQQAFKLRVLRKYLISTGISSALAHRVQENAMHVLMRQQSQTPEESVELMSLISDPLRMEVHFEIFSPLFVSHPLFHGLMSVDDTLIRQLCHRAMKTVDVACGDVLFSQGETSQEPKMLFVITGTLEYTVDAVDFVTIKSKDWITEHALWTDWVYHGLLAASSTCTVACLDAVVFEQVSNAELPINFAEYAKAFVRLVNNQTAPTDLIDYETTAGLLQEVAPHIKPRTRKQGGRLFSGLSGW